MPAAIWPYLMLLSAVLAAVCAFTSQQATARALLAIIGAYACVRINAAVFAGTDLYHPLGALIWAICAAYVFRSGFAAGGGIIAASALCYYWAKLVEADRVIGSAPYVASDILAVIAMVWIGGGGIGVFLGKIFDVDCREHRDLRCGDRVYVVQAAESEIKEGP